MRTPAKGFLAVEWLIEPVGWLWGCVKDHCHSGARPGGREPGTHIPEAGVLGFRAHRCVAPRNDNLNLARLVVDRIGTGFERRLDRSGRRAARPIRAGTAGSL